MGVGVGAGVGVGVGAGVGAFVGVGTGVTVGTGVAVGTGVDVGAFVGVGAGVVVGTGVEVGTGVGVGAGEGAGVGAGAEVGVGEGAGVDEGVGATVGVGDGAATGVPLLVFVVSSLPPQPASAKAMDKASNLIAGRCCVGCATATTSISNEGELFILVELDGRQRRSRREGIAHATKASRLGRDGTLTEPCRRKRAVAWAFHHRARRTQRAPRR